MLQTGTTPVDDAGLEQLDAVVDQLMTQLALARWDAPQDESNSALSARLHASVASGDPLVVATAAMKLCLRGETIASPPGRIPPISPKAGFAGRASSADDLVREAARPWMHVVERLNEAREMSLRELARLQSTKDSGADTKEAIQIHAARIRLAEQVLGI